MGLSTVEVETQAQQKELAGAVMCFDKQLTGKTLNYYNIYGFSHILAVSVEKINLSLNSYWKKKKTYNWLDNSCG